jgi:uncharacterized membrane protein
MMQTLLLCTKTGQTSAKTFGAQLVHEPPSSDSKEGALTLAPILASYPEVDTVALRAALQVLIEQRKEQRRVQQITQWQGPIPPASELAAFENVQPGLADRIIQMAEKQADHRIRSESQIIETERSNSAKGLNYGLIIVLAGLCLAAYAFSIGYSWQGVAICGVELGSVAGLFVTREWRKHQESTDTQGRSQEPTPPDGNES